MGVVTWFTALTNHRHSARSVPYCILHSAFRSSAFYQHPVKYTSNTHTSSCHTHRVGSSLKTGLAGFRYLLHRPSAGARVLEQGGPWTVFRGTWRARAYNGGLGAEPPVSWKLLSSRTCNGHSKFVSFAVFTAIHYNFMDHGWRASIFHGGPGLAPTLHWRIGLR